MDSCNYIYETDLLLSQEDIQVIYKTFVSLWNFKESSGESDEKEVKPTEAQRYGFHSFPGEKEQKKEQ